MKQLILKCPCGADIEVEVELKDAGFTACMESDEQATYEHSLGGLALSIRITPPVAGDKGGGG